MLGLRQERTAKMVLLLLVLMAAAALRIILLDSLPPGLYHDEAYNGLDALSLVEGKLFPQYYEGWELYALDAHEGAPVQNTRWPVFFEGNYGREPLHVYLMALAIRFLGIRPVSIRLVPALAGILGIFTTYLAVKALQKKAHLRDQAANNGRVLFLDTALIAAFFSAILFPAIHFSRFGVRGMLIVPLETLTVYFFWLGINGGSVPKETRRLANWVYFLLAGIFLGLAVYSYVAARLLPLLFVIFVPFWFWVDREAKSKHWRNILLMAGSAFLVALPLGLYFFQNPYFFFFRIGFVANRGEGAVEGKPLLTWLMNLGRVFRGLILQGDANIRLNLPGRPFLDPVQSGLFLVGVIHSIRRRFQIQFVFLWIWLIVMLLPSVLSGDAPHFGRMIGAIPPLTIFIALGLRRLIRELFARITGWRRPAILAILGMLMILSTSLSVRDYFRRYANHPELSQAFQEVDWKLGKYAYGHGENRTLYLVPNQLEMATIYYALGDPEGIRSFNGEANLIPAGIPGQETLYFIRKENLNESAEILEELSDYFPEGEAVNVQEGLTLFIVPSDAPRIRLPGSDEITASELQNAYFEDKIKLLAWSLKHDRDQLIITLIRQAVRDMQLDYTVFIHVLDDNGRLVSQRDRMPAGYPTSDWQEGEIIVEQYHVSLPEALGLATYTLETGFYYLPSMERLGEPVFLTEISVP